MGKQDASLKLPFILIESQGPRTQIDRTLYKNNMQKILFDYPNLSIKAGSVYDLVTERSHADSNWGKIQGVQLGG